MEAASATSAPTTEASAAHPEFYARPQCQWYHYSTGDFSPFGQQGMVYLRALTQATGTGAAAVSATAIQDAYYGY